MNRAQDWWQEAVAEYQAAQTLHQAGHHAWCCFTAQQAAEKAVKGALDRLLRPGRGHNLVDLVTAAGGSDQALLDACRRLNRLYMTTRYPDAVPSGAPSQAFGATDAQQALEDAQHVLDFAQGIIGSP